jgi:urate oxidase
MPVSFRLKENSYGKQGVRLVKVERHGTWDTLKDIDVEVRMTGDFAAAYEDGDNRLVLPTDTMKNTVYAMAGRGPIGEIEEFGLRLANHFLARHAHMQSARIGLSENLWQDISPGGRLHGQAFRLAGPERRAAVVDRDRDRTSITASISDLTVLKTSQSAFEDFLRDELTTLKESRDRLFGTSVNAEWTYRNASQDFGGTWRGVRETLLESFAQHESLSVQHTEYAMGQAVLQRFESIEEIRLSMPNRHCLPVDLAPLGLENRNEVFMPIDAPNGIIEAVIAREPKGQGREAQGEATQLPATAGARTP